MTKLTKDQMRTRDTLLAARAFNRRTMLKGAAAAGAVTLGFPMIVKDAFSSSGELNLLMWSDEFPDPVIPNFEKATGIKVNQTPFSQNEEQINKLQATGGEGFDICQPTCNRAPQYKDLQVLAPWDTNKLKNMSALVPSMIANSKGLWTWEDGLHHLPHRLVTSICPECDEEVYVDAESEQGDRVSCDECGSGLVVVGLDPVELDLYEAPEKEDYGDEVDYEAYDYENDRY